MDMDMAPAIERSAVLSHDRQYRYRLDRVWLPPGTFRVMWVMLNPSSADELTDDHTIRRCMALSDSWGYSGLAVANLFSLRSTDPNHLLAHPDPVGPENDRYLREMAEEFDVIVAAWGSSLARSQLFVQREREVKDILRGKMSCMEITAKGNPKHPSRIRSDVELKPFLR